MRITSGIYKNTALKSSENSHTHPMGDREKIALMNILTPVLPKADVLDLYAGTGALGLEALSRGAAHVDFVEKNSAACSVIKENINSALKSSEKIAEKTRIFRTSVETYVPDHLYSLVLADPPYDLVKTLDLSNLETFVAPGGTLALSLPKDSPIPIFSTLSLKSDRTYARMRLLIYS